MIDNLISVFDIMITSIILGISSMVDLVALLDIFRHFSLTVVRLNLAIDN